MKLIRTEDAAGQVLSHDITQSNLSYAQFLCRLLIIANRK